jgi:hypothetical protein
VFINGPLALKSIRFIWHAVQMIHDATTTSRASTACHYSPSLMAEEQVRGSKDTLTLKGEKVLLELLLDMVCYLIITATSYVRDMMITSKKRISKNGCVAGFTQALDQRVNGKELITHDTEDSDFENYLRVATGRVLDQTAFTYGAFWLLAKLFCISNCSGCSCSKLDNATTAISSALAAKPGGALDLGTPSTTLPKEATLPAEESATSSATKKDVQSLHWFVSIIIETIPFF